MGHDKDGCTLYFMVPLCCHYNDTQVTAEGAQSMYHISRSIRWHGGRYCTQDKLETRVENQNKTHLLHRKFNTNSSEIKVARGRSRTNKSNHELKDKWSQNIKRNDAQKAYLEKIRWLTLERTRVYFQKQRTVESRLTTVGWLVELEQMTCNPVKGSEAGALRSSTHFSPLIESSTWNGPLKSSLWCLVILPLTSV